MSDPQRRKVPVSARTLEGMPWVTDCTTCRRLEADPEPGLLFWLKFTAEHFRDDHAIDLVGA